MHSAAEQEFVHNVTTFVSNSIWKNYYYFDCLFFVDWDL